MLEVRDLHLHYGASHALRGVSLDLLPGTVTCLLGRNGVGKTSLLRAIMGQARTSSGSVRLGGESIDGLPTWRRARQGLGIVPQGREIFPRLTVAENLETGFAMAGTRGGRTVPPMVLERFPVLQEMLQRRGGDLSGGQQQQLAIGRALVGAPQVLLLDEPTEGIQPNIVQLIGKVIQDLARSTGLAILLVEQYLDFALGLGDHFLVMDKGRIVLDGARGTFDPAEARGHLTV